MKPDCDLIADVLDFIQDALQTPIAPELRLKVEKAARQRYGGSEFYVRKSVVDIESRNAAIKAEYRQGHAKEVAAKFGVSRATVYRAIGADSRKFG